MGRPRLHYLKQVTRYTGADGYTAMKRMACNKSRWKAANQSKDDDDDDDDNNNIYLLQLGCHPVAVVILHVYKI